MRTTIKNLALLFALLAGLGLNSAGRVAAQTLTNLHSFTPLTNDANSDGVLPEGGLISSGATLYGTAEGGGSSGNGTIFAVGTNGTGFTNLYSFTAETNDINNDGTSPEGSLILSGAILYGTAAGGGTGGSGTVFAINTNGSGFTNLHNFTATLGNAGLSGGGTNSDGNTPLSSLLLSGSTLYGEAAIGGTAGNGTLFALSTNGMGFTNMHNFTALSGVSSGTNADGAFPNDNLILSGNTLYGTAYEGGSSGFGTVFAINLDGSGFTNLYNFTGGSNGMGPSGGLILSGNTLYGTTFKGGNAGRGTVFALTTNGTGFTNLHIFAALVNHTNSDGVLPEAGLVLSRGTLYGTTYEGGSLGFGTVFSINTNGLGFTALYNFTAPNPQTSSNSDGAFTEAGVILAGNTLYGTATDGGSWGNGTVFGLLLQSITPPLLSIMAAGTNVVLTWTNTATGFTLQSTTNLVPAAWATVLPPPVVVNGQYTVTNPISGTQQYYRLSD
jgi:uncharacterized repeat protein (TIGR03803 family)